MRTIAPATYRRNTKFEMVTRRGVALTLVSETFADILRQITRDSPLPRTGDRTCLPIPSPRRFAP